MCQITATMFLTRIQKFTKYNNFVINARLKANCQVNKMTDLIHGFPDLSKIELGKLQLKMQDFEINKLIYKTIAELKPTSECHIINVSTRLPGGG
jgi:two-component system sensor histidine kinase VicK